jgi:hypothetical protein
MKEPRVSPCCGVTVVLESIWLNMNPGRKEIGTVQRCAKATCQKIISDVKGSIKASEWSMMLRYHKDPPYYFNKTPQGLVPETAPQDAWKKATQVSAPVAQDLAAGDYDPREDQ